MGRPRRFEEATVLDAAAAEFRVHGFADTSTERLCEVTGLQRGSLYNAFVSKDELFVRALERYATTYRERQAATFAETGLTGADRLRAVMSVVIDEESAASAETHGAGCMIVHSMMSPDLRERDERVARIVEGDLRERLRLLEAVIRIGRVDGSVPVEVDPAEGAILFVTVVNGVRVMGQAGVAPETLRSVALSGISALLA